MQRYFIVPGTWATGRAHAKTDDPPDYWEDGGALVTYLASQGWVNVAVGRSF